MQIAHKIIFAAMLQPIPDHLVDYSRIDQRTIAGNLDHHSGVIMQCRLIMPVQQIPGVAAVTKKTLLTTNLYDHVIFRLNRGGNHHPTAEPSRLYTLRLTDKKRFA